MNITKLSISNVKKIKAVTITPSDNMVKITGKNGNGKSSVLDSISMVLGGAKNIPSQPIRDDEETAKITAKLSNGWLVERSFSRGVDGAPKIKSINITTAEGIKLKNGQSLLDSIVGTLSFDPLAFVTMDKKKRMDLLKKVTSLDFNDLESNYDDDFENRRELKRDLEKLSCKLSDMPKLKKIHPLNKSIEEINQLKKADADINELIDIDSMDFLHKQEKLSDLKESATDLEKKYKEMGKELSELYLKIEALKKHKEPNISLKKDLSIWDEMTKLYYENQLEKGKLEEQENLKSEIDNLSKTIQELTNNLMGYRKEKALRISSAKMPIDNLSIENSEIIFNKIPFDQLSTAEKIKISMSLAIAINPKLKLAMIYDGSLLDSDSMKEIHTIAKDKDVQVWVEVVASEPSENSIYIEDGCIN